LSTLNNIWQILKGEVVWLSRIGHCRGFGIQSPNDYWLVRYVINEHWPYYQYETLGQGDDWQTRKLGRLCFRLANWRRPSVIDSRLYRAYLQAGCQSATFGTSTELVVLSLADDGQDRLTDILNKVSPESVLVMMDISKAKDVWRKIVADNRTGITFDLYYCGIVLFDKKRHKQNYLINF